MQRRALPLRLVNPGVRAAGEDQARWLTGVPTSPWRGSAVLSDWGTGDAGTTLRNVGVSWWLSGYMRDSGPGAASRSVSR